MASKTHTSCSGSGLQFFVVPWPGLVETRVAPQWFVALVATQFQLTGVARVVAQPTAVRSARGVHGTSTGLSASARLRRRQRGYLMKTSQTQKGQTKTSVCLARVVMCVRNPTVSATHARNEGGLCPSLSTFVLCRSCKPGT